MESQSVIAIDPDYSRGGQTAELALVQRLLAMTRDVPRSYPVCLTAGELLVLLETLAARTVQPIPLSAPASP
jgi:hypothetical protein